MQKLLATLVRKDGGRSAPTNREPLGIERIPRLDKR
jgi:hypothetical protein